MLLKSIWAVMRRRPVLGLRLLRDAVFDRLGRHRDSPEVHLLQVLRFVSGGGWSLDLDSEDRLELSAPVDSPASRFRLRLRDSDVRVFREVIVHQAYGEALAALGEVRDDLWVVDAGANIGLSTLYVLKRFPRARVVALEPDPENVDQIRWHISHNRCEQVRIIPAALWSRRTKLRFIGNDDPVLSWGLRVEAGEDGSVPAVSVDDLLRDHEIDRIDLLKLDVEGSEFAVFADPGAGQWLARVRVIIMEVHPNLGDPRQIVDVLARAGFSMKDLGGNILLARRVP